MKRHLKVQHHVIIGAARSTGPYKDRDEYTSNCVEYTVMCNLPLTRWIKQLVQERDSRL